MKHLWRRLPWLANLDLALLLSMLVVVGGAWAFIVIAQAVGSGQSHEFDEYLIRFFRQTGKGTEPAAPQWLVEINRDITALGSFTALTLVTATVAGYLLLVRKTHAFLLLVAATIGAAILSYVLKDYFDRSRPNLVPHLAHVSSPSFPSGHSMLSATVYLTLGTLLAQLVGDRRLKMYFVSIALFLTFIIGLSRIFLGVHWPTDVLAGWAAGLTWALLCGLVAGFLQRKGAVETSAA